MSGGAGMGRILRGKAGQCLEGRVQALDDAHSETGAGCGDAPFSGREWMYNSASQMWAFHLLHTVEN